MVQVVQPIETAYAGCRFRSRIEARWAVVFDQLNVPWEYEREGFTLGSTRYLPDFWLPSLECWVEIKGQTPSDNEVEKAFRLARATGRDVFVFFGQIPRGFDYLEELDLGRVGLHGGTWGNGHAAYAFFGRPKTITRSDSFKRTLNWDYSYWWTECAICGLVGIEFEGRDGRLPCGCHKDGNYIWNWDNPRITAAYIAARSARFERGS